MLLELCTAQPKCQCMSTLNLPPKVELRTQWSKAWKSAQHWMDSADPFPFSPQGTFPHCRIWGKYPALGFGYFISLGLNLNAVGFSPFCYPGACKILSGYWEHELKSRGCHPILTWSTLKDLTRKPLCFYLLVFWQLGKQRCGEHLEHSRWLTCVGPEFAHGPLSSAWES